jgi:anti-sigma factor RsiW
MSARDEMTCKEVVEVITDYLEGRLRAEDRQRFEAHLEVCSYCATYLDQMRETIATLGTLRTESLSPETREGLLEAFRGWRGVA